MPVSHHLALRFGDVVVGGIAPVNEITHILLAEQLGYLTSPSKGVFLFQHGRLKWEGEGRHTRT